MIGHSEIIERSLKLQGVTLRYPFDPRLPVLYVGSRMFALLGRTGEAESANLKADPEESWLLRQQYPRSVLPGYHMNKKHWNTVLLDGSVPDAEILAMLEQSYLLVKLKLTRREREEAGIE